MAAVTLHKVGQLVSITPAFSKDEFGLRWQLQQVIPKQLLKTKDSKSVLVPGNLAHDLSVRSLRQGQSFPPKGSTFLLSEDLLLSTGSRCPTVKLIEWEVITTKLNHPEELLLHPLDETCHSLLRLLVKEGHKLGNSSHPHWEGFYDKSPEQHLQNAATEMLAISD